MLPVGTEINMTMLINDGSSAHVKTNSSSTFTHLLPCSIEPMDIYGTGIFVLLEHCVPSLGVSCPVNQDHIVASSLRITYGNQEFRKHRRKKVSSEVWLNIYQTSAMFRHLHRIQNSNVTLHV
jgi:hypothetical protein